MAFLAATLLGVLTTSAHAHGDHRSGPQNLLVFGDSLSDTGNLASLAGGAVPGDFLNVYFNGRFSDGPVWVETFAERLGLNFEIAAPFESNWAVAGAFSGESGLFDPLVMRSTGLLSQIEQFLTTPRAFDQKDLIVVWAGANDYFAIPLVDPMDVVRNLKTAIERLIEEAGAQRVLVPNLPDLGKTPLAIIQGQAVVDALSSLTAAHNSLLAEMVTELTHDSGIEIFVVDVNTALSDVLGRQRLYGFENVTLSCIIQQPDGSRPASGLCPRSGDSLDSTGVLFWDLIHPTGTTHELLAVFADSTFTTRDRLPERIFDPERIATRIALAKMRAFGAFNTFSRAAERESIEFHVRVLYREFRSRH